MGPAATRLDAWGPLRSALTSWTWLARTSEIWWTRQGGPAMVAAARSARLAALVRYARDRSAFYRLAYRDVPATGVHVTDLPVVAKRDLMARFDDWVTDREVTRAGVEAFIAAPERIGSRYLGRYVVWKSSGTTGEPGIFVQDDDALDVGDALIAAQFDATGIAPRVAQGMFTHAGRAALIAATGEHFASVASWRRLCSGGSWQGSRCLSVLDPLPDLVAELNAYDPAFVASYPTMLRLLAAERRAGRLRIAPDCLWAGGEYLAPATRTGIEHAFACPLVNEYGASECMSIAFGCPHGWLHVNADWVILEPIDRDGRPTPPGEPSHSVLLSNLANRVQPVLRYDLGDSVTVKAEPCPCGSPLPAIQVEGRRDDILALTARDGTVVRLLPLALSTVVEEAADVHRFQIVQDGPARLRLRLDLPDAAERASAGRAASRALREYLQRQSLPNVRVVLDAQAPAREPRSGKLRQVIKRSGSEPKK